MSAKPIAIVFLFTIAIILSKGAGNTGGVLLSQTTELGVGFFPGDSSYDKNRNTGRKLTPSEETFAARASEHFKTDKKEIEKLLTGGFYKKEIVKIMIISREAAKPLKDIVLMRKKRTTFADICRQLGIDYKKISSEASEFLSQ